MPAISVIMPVYNAQAYLAAAIDSLLAQTFTDFELLLIDDGSADASGRICDDYAGRDGRVTVVHQENGGICAARNRGIDLARGDFVAFMDNDDTVRPELLAVCHEQLVRHDADVVKFGYQVRKTFAGGGESQRDTVAREAFILRGDERTPQYERVKRSGFFYMIWNGVYRRSFLQAHGLRFDETVKFGYEDWIFNYQLYRCLQCAVILNTVLYIHEQRAGVSTSTKFRVERPRNCIVAASNEKAMYDELEFDRAYPGLWNERLAEYIIEMLLLFQLQDCPLTRGEKVDFLRETSKLEPFDIQPSSEELRQLGTRSRKKAMVLRLFAGRRFPRLLWLGGLYNVWLRRKVKN